MPACPNGAAPNTAGTNAQNIWVDITTFGQSLVTEWKRLIPWLPGAIPSRFMSVIDLCNLNPDPPAPLTADDFKTTALDIWSGPILPPGVMNKVWQQLYYDAFTQLCQCNPYVGACVETVYDVNTATNACWNPGSNSYCWPTVQTGTSNTVTFVPVQLPFLCPVMDIFVDTVPHVPNLILNSLNIYDCAGVNHGRETQAGSTTRVTMTNCPNDPQHTSLNLIISAFNGGGTPHWIVKVTPVGGGSGGTTPPAQPPNQTSGIPTPPALVCDPAGSCNVQWGIINNLTNVLLQNSTTIEQLAAGGATDYVTGNTYPIVGQGVQVVAAGTLGVVVQLTVIPPSFNPTPTNPPRYYDIGWIQIGAADALDGKRWIHSSGDRFIPVFPEMDRVHFNLAPGVQATLIELLPPAPTLPDGTTPSNSS